MRALSRRRGDSSQLARVYELGGWVLLLGVAHTNNTPFHLGEFRAWWPGQTIVEQGAPLVVDGARRWATYPDLELDPGDFDAIGSDFARDTAPQASGPAGAGTALLFPQRSAVDYAAGWIPADHGSQRLNA